MTGSREALLSRIRRSLGVDGADAGRRAIVISRLDNPPLGVVPARGQLPQAEKVALFATMAERASASVARVVDTDAVPEALAAYLRDRNLPASIRMGDDPFLAALPFARTPQIAIRRGPSEGNDLVTLSHAFTGVAETGTLALLSGPDNPTTLNFLPDTHVVVLAAGDILGDYESVWDRVRTQHGKGAMPRTVNFITGPSRSADIEQTLLLGAHGPRALHIVIVG